MKRNSNKTFLIIPLCVKALSLCAFLGSITLNGQDGSLELVDFSVTAEGATGEDYNNTVPLDVSADASAPEDAIALSGGSAEARDSGDATGINGDVSVDLSSAITVDARGGFADATIQPPPESEGTVTATAVALANATGVFGEVTGDVSTEVTTKSVGGTALGIIAAGVTATPNANANAETLGIQTVIGALSGTIRSTSEGGVASVNDADSADNEDDYSAEATATADANGLSDLNGDMTEGALIQVDASGGQAIVFSLEEDNESFSKSASASADANAYGFNGEGDIETYSLSGSIFANAAGGMATVNSNVEANASANADASGIYTDSIYNDGSESSEDSTLEISGSIEAIATGGTSTADSQGGGSANANATAAASGIYVDELYAGSAGDNTITISSSIEATAVGGTSTANSQNDSNANANSSTEAFSIYNEYIYIEEDSATNKVEITGSFKASATDGTANATAQGLGNANADAESDARGTYEDIYIDSTGDSTISISGSFESIADSGEATAEAQNNATASTYALAVGIEDDIYIDSNGNSSLEISGDFTISANGGDSEAVGQNSANAAANAWSVGIDDGAYLINNNDETLNENNTLLISSSMEVVATGGAATAESQMDADANADAEADGINDEIFSTSGGTPEFSGLLEATAKGGTADADSEDEADATSNADATGIDALNGTLSGAVETYAIGGTATATSLEMETTPEIESPSEDSASANANSFGIYYFAGDMTEESSITAKARSGRATVNNDDGSADADAQANAYGVVSTYGKLSADEEGFAELSGTITAKTILGEVSELSEPYVTENTGTETDSTSVSMASATGRTIVDANSTASAGAIFDEDGKGLTAVFTETFTANVEAIAGDAYAESTGLVGENASEASATATADAYATTLDTLYGFEGSFSGSVYASAESGFAESESLSSATANAVSYAAVAFFEGSAANNANVLFTDTFYAELDAKGGRAVASSENDSATANAQTYAIVLEGVTAFQGDFGGEVNVTAIAAAVDGDDDYDESDPFMNPTALAGSTINSRADASSDAYVVEFKDFESGDDDDGGSSEEIAAPGTFAGNFTAEVTLLSAGGNAIAGAGVGMFEGGSSTSTSAIADASASAGLIVNAEAFIGDYSGALTAESLGGYAFILNEAQLVSVLADESISTAITGLNGSYEILGNRADASARTVGIQGSVQGQVGGTMDLIAGGGFSEAINLNGDYSFANSSAHAAAIYGSLEGDFTGTLSISSNGGEAVLRDTFGLLDDGGEDSGSEGGSIEISALNGVSLLEVNSASAAAFASGIGGIDGDLSGPISVNATGGTVAELSETIISSSESELPLAYLPGAISEIEVGGYDAHGEAYGISGNVISETVDSTIQVSATGGTILFNDEVLSDGGLQGDPPSIQVGAFAAGMAGQSIQIDNFSGNILAIATPGLWGFVSLEGDGGDQEDEISGMSTISDILELSPQFSLAGDAFAVGIMTYDPVADDGLQASSLETSISNLESATPGLNVVIHSSIIARVEAPEDYTFTEDNVYAAAIYSGQANDTIVLAEGAYIVGDINTGGGENTLRIIGDTVMEGNISSSALSQMDDLLGIDNGDGAVDFDIESGLFKPVGTVFVTDLQDALEIGADGGLLTSHTNNLEDDEDAEDKVNSRIVVSDGENSETSGDVIIAAGATIKPYFTEDTDFLTLLDNSQTIIEVDGEILDNGAVIDPSLTPFLFSKEIVDDDGGGQSLVLNVEGVGPQDGHQTPGAVHSIRSLVMANQTTLADISQRLQSMRLLLREPAEPAPTGPFGPDPAEPASRDWITYLSVFGSIGGQGSTGNYAGFDLDSHGATVGLEKILGQQLIVAIATSYARVNVDGTKNSGGGDSDIYSLVAYANWFAENHYFDGGLMYAWADNDVTRIDWKSDAYRGNFNSNTYGAWFEFGGISSLDCLILEPFARVTYFHSDHDGFTEKGPDPAVMTTRSEQTENFITELGARLNKDWELDENRVINVEAKLAWQHEWADRGVWLDASYLGDSSVSIRGADASRDAVVLGLSSEFVCTESGLGFRLDYEPTFASNWYNHAFSGAIEYNF